MVACSRTRVLEYYQFNYVMETIYDFGTVTKGLIKCHTIIQSNTINAVKETLN